jgi:hypothetical protein
LPSLSVELFDAGNVQLLRHQTGVRAVPAEHSLPLHTDVSAGYAVVAVANDDSFDFRAQLTITEALRRGKPVVFCPRCGYKCPDCNPVAIKGDCPDCNQPGLDSVAPNHGAMA